jgi:ribosomal protein S18 acetylase RimI-like enzyme
VVVDGRPALVEANVRAFLLEMGRAGGGVERDDDEITWTVGGSPIGYHNAVVACRASPDRAGLLVEAWATELDRRGLPGSWHLSPSMAPDDLERRLLAAGFDDGGDEPAMAADLTAEVPAGPPVPDLAVGRVAGAGDLEAYGEVLAGGFGEGPVEAEWVAEVFGRIGLGADVPWRHLLGTVDGHPVATATLFVHPVDVAGIYFVCTAPSERRQGIGAAITRAAMEEAKALGCRSAVLGSSPMGHGIYRRLGFEEVFRYRLLERSPDASQRTTSSSRPLSTS